MKISLALGPRRALSRQTAWGCLTSNLALPGSGSLLAGRVSGYAQLALSLIGLLMTLIFGVRFAVWYFANQQRLSDDPTAMLLEMWLAMRWALLSIGVFGFAWFWGLITGWQIVQGAKAAERANVPPRLGS
jgi:hypothetical protein